MISQLRELFKLKNLLSTMAIPLFAFLILGYAQRNIYDWMQLKNTGYQRAIEIGVYLVILILLYIVFLPVIWIRPPLKLKIHKEGSALARPETSAVFSLASRDQDAIITIILEFTSSRWTRFFVSRMDPRKLGVQLSWKPPGLLSCSSTRASNAPYCNIRNDGVVLYPFEKMDLYSPNQIEYSFRFALGTTQVKQSSTLRPRHLNSSSRCLFGLDCDTDFLFEIKEQ